MPTVVIICEGEWIYESIKFRIKSLIKSLSKDTKILYRDEDPREYHYVHQASKSGLQIKSFVCFYKDGISAGSIRDIRMLKSGVDHLYIICKDVNRLDSHKGIKSKANRLNIPVTIIN